MLIRVQNPVPLMVKENPNFLMSGQYDVCVSNVVLCKFINNLSALLQDSTLPALLQMST